MLWFVDSLRDLLKSAFSALRPMLIATAVFGAAVDASSEPSAIIQGADFGVFDDDACGAGLAIKATDQTSFLRRALTSAAGQRLVLPRGAKICLNTPNSTLRVASPVSLDMNAATIRWNAPPGTPTAPIIDFLPSASGFELIGDGVFDGQNDRIKYLDSEYFGKGSYRGGGDALLSVQANGTINGVRAIAAFDSCIQIAAFDAKGIIKAGQPDKGRVSNVSTANCGVGEHGITQGEGGPGKGGAGVNNGSGRDWAFNNLRDTGSYQGFGCDVGAGAGCNVTNFTGLMTKFDERFPAGPTGNCVYNGARSATFTKVLCVAPGLRGVSSDGDAAEAIYSKVAVYSPARECIEIKGNSRWNDVVCNKNNESPAVVVNNLQPHPISVLLVDLDICEKAQSRSVKPIGLLIEGLHDIIGTAAISESVGISELMHVSSPDIRHFTVTTKSTGGR